jgi:hypothetical protein
MRTGLPSPLWRQASAASGNTPTVPSAGPMRSCRHPARPRPSPPISLERRHVRQVQAIPASTPDPSSTSPLGRFAAGGAQARLRLPAVLVRFEADALAAAGPGATEAAMREAVAGGATAVWLVGGTGEREG